MRAGRRAGRRARAGGFTYVWVLMALLLLSLGLSAVGPAWAERSRREREAELLRIGALYAEAIRRYHDQSPGTLKQFPPTLQALLLDERFLGVRRHLRRLYGDPMNAYRPWQLLRAPDGGIRGVYSAGTDMPFITGAVRLDSLTLPPARRYSDWVFAPEVKP